MASKPPVYCQLCNEPLEEDEELEEHLLSEHDWRELAQELAADWESEQLGDQP